MVAVCRRFGCMYVLIASAEKLIMRVSGTLWSDAEASIKSVGCCDEAWTSTFEVWQFDWTMRCGRRLWNHWLADEDDDDDLHCSLVSAHAAACKEAAPLPACNIGCAQYSLMKAPSLRKGAGPCSYPGSCPLLQEKNKAGSNLTVRGDRRYSGGPNCSSSCQNCVIKFFCLYNSCKHVSSLRCGRHTRTLKKARNISN